MSERWTYDYDNHGCEVIFNREKDAYFSGDEVVAMLNERDYLAAQVETLRELLRRSESVIHNAVPSIRLWLGHIEKHGIVGVDHVQGVLDEMESVLSALDHQERGDDAAHDGA